MSEYAGVIIAMLLTLPAGADVLSDPMRPYSGQVQAGHIKARGVFVLSAILYSADRRVAIVNGRLVSEGQRVNGARVTRIQRGRVELEVDGQLLKLALVTDKPTK